MLGKLIRDKAQLMTWYTGETNFRALELYKHNRCEPGDFLKAVLEGDLYTAAARADIDNQQRLYHITHYIVNNLPSESYGSIEKVRKWLKRT